PLADVMTDKATVEIPSPVAGRVVSLGSEPGQLMAVGADLIRIETDGAGSASQASAVGPGQEEPSGSGSRDQPRSSGTAPENGKAPDALQAPDIPDTPHAAEAPDVGSVDDKEVGKAITPGGASQHETVHAKPLASPAVRKHARELDIELRAVAGSGPGGRILHRDLDAFASRATAGAEAASGALQVDAAGERPAAQLA